MAATHKGAERSSTRRSRGKNSKAGRKPRVRAATKAPTKVMVVDMIPRALSAETNQDSEPHLTVNPADPLHIVGTAFTPDPSGGSNAPIFISRDGGRTWVLNSIVPSAPGSATHDITTAFSGTADHLYAGILRAPSSDLDFLRTTSFASATPMAVTSARPNADQPFAHATTVPSGADKGRERIYVGDNDFQAAPATATVDVSLNGGAGFTSVRIEKRSTAGQNGPQIRPVSHPDGVVYAAFYRWRSMTGSFPSNTLVITSADVVVVRDDNWGKGSTPFTALQDPGDGLPGLRVVQGVSMPFMIAGTAATGQQRLGGSLSIAVSPLDAATVVLAWCDRRPGSILTLHVRSSTDRGVTWSSQDLLTVPNATNAALAINAVGRIGILYQELRRSAASRRWVTHFRRSPGGTAWDDLVLADVPANTPAKVFDPYVGDYDHLVAAGKDFYGIFSANNTPDPANFPQGVRFLRNVNTTTQKLLRLDNVTTVPPSIDPFFFHVQG
jgi:hypothetical protein